MRTTLQGAVAALSLFGAGAWAQVPWQAETQFAAGASTAGVAIAVNSTTPASSRIAAGALLSNGLYSYSLDGTLTGVSGTGLGPLRSVASRSGVALSSVRGDLVAASGYASGQLGVFSLSASGVFTEVLVRPLLQASVGQVALSVNRGGGLELFYDDGSPTLKRRLLSDVGDGGLDFADGSPVTLPGIPAALAVDDRSRRLYATVPGLGVVAVDLDGTGAARVLEPVDGGALGGLPSGIDLLPLADGGTVVLVSIPLTNELVAYSAGASSLTALTRFTLALDGGARPVHQPEQLAATARPLPGFPSGLLVVHDKFNGGAGANYKLVNWATAAGLTSPPLPPLLATFDAGLPGDGGAGDGGSPDAGLSDGGLPGADGGSASDGGGGGTGGGGGFHEGGGDVVEPKACGCATDAALIPLGFVLGFALLFRRRS